MPRCKLCKQTFVKVSPWQKCDKPECALQHVRIDAEKKKAAQARAWERQKSKQKQAEAKQKAEFKKNDKPNQLKLTEKAFNKLRVLQELKWFSDRSMEPTCISCGRPLGGDKWSCGHLRTVKNASQLRYDPRNTWLQHSWSCNSNKSGDIVNYKIGLKRRFGEEEGQRIIDYVETNNGLANWTCEELIQMRKDFNKEIRSLIEFIRP